MEAPLDCLFCSIAKHEIPAHIVFENNELLAFRDRNPVAPTHILIIPKRHIANLNDIDTADTTLLGDMILTAKQIAHTEGLSEAGYRLNLNINRDGGQTIYHLHLHLLGGRPMTWPPG